MRKATQLRWAPHAWLSAMHAARTVGRSGQCTDAKTETQLAVPVASLNSRLIAQSVDVSAFWSEVIRLVATSKDGPTSKRDEQAICEAALSVAGVSEFQLEQTIPAIADLLRQCRSAFNERFPKLTEQLDLRGKPLKQSWNTYGPGLLKTISEKIWDGEPPDDWWPTSCDVRLVQPVSGGMGDVTGDRLWIEAMLTDADPRVPEVLRIAWLVTRIAIARNIRERSGDSMSSLPWTKAATVITLESGVDIGLLPAGELPIATACECWSNGDPAVASVLKRWWTEYQQTKPAMPVALKALRRMLDSQRETESSRKQSMDASIDLENLDDDMKRELGLLDD